MKLEDYSKYFIQGSDHYLIPKDIFVELFNEMTNWKQESRRLNEQLKLYVGGLKREHEATQRAYDLEVENKKLKKELEEINKMIEKCGFVNVEQVMLNYCGLLSQQQEFIKYLEVNRDRCLTFYSRTECAYAYDVFKEILQKYKEIMGEKDENK